MVDFRLYKSIERFCPPGAYIQRRETRLIPVILPRMQMAVIRLLFDEADVRDLKLQPLAVALIHKRSGPEPGGK